MVGLDRPLKAEVVIVRVTHVKLFHSIRRDRRRIAYDAICLEMFVCTVDVRTTEIYTRVMVARDAGRVGLVGTLAVIVCGVEHDRRGAEPGHAPTGFVALARITPVTKSEASPISSKPRWPIKHLPWRG